jgi:hypothetical protein
VRSGLGKLMDINAFIASMPGRGVPGWLGYVAAPVEFFGFFASFFPSRKQSSE